MPALRRTKTKLPNVPDDRLGRYLSGHASLNCDELPFPFISVLLNLRLPRGLGDGEGTERGSTLLLRGQLSRSMEKTTQKHGNQIQGARVQQNIKQQTKVDITRAARTAPVKVRRGARSENDAHLSWTRTWGIRVPAKQWQFWLHLQQAALVSASSDEGGIPRVPSRFDVIMFGIRTTHPQPQSLASQAYGGVDRSPLAKSWAFALLAVCPR